MTIKTIDDIIVAYVNQLQAALPPLKNAPEPQTDPYAPPTWAREVAEESAAYATAQPKAAPNDEPIKPLGGTLSGPSYNEVTGENVELRKRVEDLEKDLERHRAHIETTARDRFHNPVDTQSFSKAFERAATDHDIVELRRVLVEYRDRVNNLQVALSERNRQIDGANEKVANLKRSADKLEGELQASTLRETHLLERNHRLQMADNRSPGPEEGFAEEMPRDALVDCLREKIAELRAEIKALKLAGIAKRP